MGTNSTEEPKQTKNFAPKIQQVIECDVFSTACYVVCAGVCVARLLVLVAGTRNSSATSAIFLFSTAFARMRGACALISLFSNMPRTHSHLHLLRILFNSYIMRRFGCLRLRKLSNLAILFLHVHTEPQQNTDTSSCARPHTHLYLIHIFVVPSLCVFHFKPRTTKEDWK